MSAARGCASGGAECHAPGSSATPACAGEYAGRSAADWDLGDAGLTMSASTSSQKSQKEERIPASASMLDLAKLGHPATAKFSATSSAALYAGHARKKM